MNPTVLAALLSSSLALLGLTVGKDGKVSEFRQEWIDGLRADVAEYIANIRQILQIRAAVHYKRRDEQQGDAEIDAATLRLNELSSRIRLRLAPEKDSSKKLIDAMKKLDELARGIDLTGNTLWPQVHVVEKATSDLLEEAWERVKTGECNYRMCIWIWEQYSLLLLL